MIIAAIGIHLLQYGFLSGIGGRATLLWLFLDAVIWATSFLGTEDGYVTAFAGGILTEFVSPYGFGLVLTAFFLCFVTADFFSRRIFTNRMLYSYLLISSLGLSVYILFLVSGEVLGNLASGSIAIFPMDFSFTALLGVFTWNLAILTMAFFITNALTQKMHAAFVMN